MSCTPVCLFGFICTNKAYFKLSISILVWRLQYYLWIYYSQLHSVGFA